MPHLAFFLLHSCAPLFQLHAASGVARFRRHPADAVPRPCRAQNGRDVASRGRGGAWGGVGPGKREGYVDRRSAGRYTLGCSAAGTFTWSPTCILRACRATWKGIPLLCALPPRLLRAHHHPLSPPVCAACACVCVAACAACAWASSAPLPCRASVVGARPCVCCVWI